MPNVRCRLTLPEWRGYQMVLMTISSWYQFLMEQSVSMFPILCPCQDLNRRTRCCKHQSSFQLSGLRQRSAFLLLSMLERFLRTDFIFFCRGWVCHLGGHLLVLIFLPNCDFFLWVCNVPIGEWHSNCNGYCWMVIIVQLVNEATTSIWRNMAEGRSWNLLFITIALYCLVW